MIKFDVFSPSSFVMYIDAKIHNTFSDQVGCDVKMPTAKTADRQNVDITYYVVSLT
jgi:hypothetical protein